MSILRQLNAVDADRHGDELRRTIAVCSRFLERSWEGRADAFAGEVFEGTNSPY